MKLYEITNAIAKLEDLAEEDTSLIPYLDSVQMQLKEKAENIIKFILNQESSINSIDAEIQRLQDYKKSYLKKVDNLKNYIAYQMQKDGIDKIETDIAKFSFRKSSSILITDETLIPSEFIKIKEVKSIDKLAIKEALKTGRKIEGALVEEKQNLQIK